MESANEDLGCIQNEHEKSVSSCINLSSTPTTVKHDPYFYTKRNEFTSEIFKIEVGNLPTYVGYEQLRKFLGSKMKLNPCKIKRIGKPSQAAFVTFRCEEDRNNALKVLQGFTWKGRDLHVKKANPMADPLVRKRKAGDAEDSVGMKKAKEDEQFSVNIRLKNAVTPLWSVPYAEQLKKKEEEMQAFLIKLGRQIEKINNKLPHPELLKQRKENNFMCCPLLPIIPSPVETEYRNKCEFSAGRHLDTGERTVGYRLSRYKFGSMSVAEPDECLHIPKTMLKAVKAFQKYVQASEKDVFDPETYQGYWRQLTVRTTRTGDIMLIVVMHPQGLNKDQLEEEKNCLKEFFSTGEGQSCKITSMYFQTFAKKEAGIEPPLEHVFGKQYVEETLLQMTFRISPDAFFQVNTLATEVLYRTIMDIADIQPSTTLLDICCGTGTIGLSMAKSVDKVIGLELCSHAVADAKWNAEVNGITNAEFLLGKAQDVIYDAIQRSQNSNTIAIVDPPRAGLHNKVIKAIRASEHLKQLVYVSCSPNTALANFTDLCRPTSNSYKGHPFYPIKAVPVDLFPQTPHCELIVVFERLSCEV